MFSKNAITKKMQIIQDEPPTLYQKTLKLAKRFHRKSTVTKAKNSTKKILAIYKLDSKILSIIKTEFEK